MSEKSSFSCFHPKGRLLPDVIAKQIDFLI